MSKFNKDEMKEVKSSLLLYKRQLIVNEILDKASLKQENSKEIANQVIYLVNNTHKFFTISSK